MRRFLILSFAFLIAAPASAQRSADGLAHASSPEAIGLVGPQLERIDDAVARAIAEREVLGAVVLVARRGKIGYLKAFGQRAVAPRSEAMTTDTIFDAASLTKVLATAPSILLLVERGDLRLDDRVRRYLPEFIGAGKDAITVRQLLTHYSGLRPDFDLSVPWEGYDATLEELWKESVRFDPGKEFIYSDLNFIALGEIVRRVSGKPLDVFAREGVYEPLGMRDTGFNPPPDRMPRIAPTESRGRSAAYLKGRADGDGDAMLRGSVHDPTAWRMGGVAGHAGLFSTARDVAIYAEMLLQRGTYLGKRIFSPLGVAAMTSAQSPRSASAIRGFGWDIDSSFSVPRGDLFGAGFGHTGFTGTSLWAHPPTDTFVVLMTSRLHPDGRGDVTHLRGVVANIVAAAVVVPR